MSGWSRWVVGDPMLADPTLDALRATLPAVPCGEAVLQRLESGELHCRLVLYFSPGIQHVAQCYGAAPCAAPARDGLSLITGDPALLKAP
ncbi:hypothetical protein [Pseudomonas abyssi]|uniref:Uncharacterized protein n=1 Tax=Pseudomonas abyssi TaxID=170540 RepID=A0A395R8Z6_9PSED|nr:hypothetical protein [Halopseudomonas gallaeciensis]RGP56574.1 hypothetical protein ASB58_04215 [Halopseudomonas gallaeciensis]